MANTRVEILLSELTHRAQECRRKAADLIARAESFEAAASDLDSAIHIDAQARQSHSASGES